MTNQPTDKRDELPATPRDDAQASDVEQILRKLLNLDRAAVIADQDITNAAKRIAALPACDKLVAAIETAPKTGDDMKALSFLGWCPDPTAPNGGDWRVCWWEPGMNKGRGCWYGDRDLVESPTHWTTLPPALSAWEKR